MDYPDALHRQGARGEEILRLETLQHGDLVQRLTISPLHMTEGGGLPSGRLPLDADTYRRALRKSLGSYRPQLEGATRVGDAQGYQLAFTATTTTRRGVVRKLLAKVVLLPEPGKRPRRGIAVEMLATTLSATKDAIALGNEGDLRQALRSIEF
jgi:hypothetical protein